jgi:hypothetical protein
MLGEKSKDGRAGSRDNSGNPGGPQAPEERGAVHHGSRPVLLVQAILGGRKEQVRAPREGLDEQRGATG